MSTSLDRLIAQATRSAENRGHSLEWWQGRAPGTAIGKCKCGALVVANTRPPLNGIDIGGDAVALNHPIRVEETSK